MNEERVGPHAGADRGVSVWTTDDVAAEARLEYWVEAISGAIFSMSTSTRQPVGFRSRRSVANMDVLVAAWAEGSNQASFRTRRFIARSSERSFHLVADFRRPWVLVWKGEKTLLMPGDLVITDSTCVHGGLFRESCNVLNLRLPERWLSTWVSRPDRLVGKCVKGTAGWGAATSSFLSKLTPENALSCAHAFREVGDHIGAMLSLIEREREGRCVVHGSRDKRRERDVEGARRIVRQRIGEETLSASDVAETLGITAVRLHRWLKDTGQTFHWLLQSERARLAARLLGSRKHARSTAQEIGRRVGLRDASRLNELLRSHFGETHAGFRLRSIGRVTTPSPGDDK